MSPIDFKVFVKSLPPISEIDFQKALIEFSVNTHNCQFDTNSSGKVTCEENVTKNAKSLLRIADFWIQLPKLHLIENCKYNRVSYFFAYKYSGGLGSYGFIKFHKKFILIIS